MGTLPERPGDDPCTPAVCHLPPTAPLPTCAGSLRPSTALRSRPRAALHLPAPKPSLARRASPSPPGLCWPPGSDARPGPGSGGEWVGLRQTFPDRQLDARHATKDAGHRWRCRPSLSGGSPGLAPGMAGLGRAQTWAWGYAVGADASPWHQRQSKPKWPGVTVTGGGSEGPTGGPQS